MKPRTLTPRYRAWIALSELYLDQELTDGDIARLAERLHATGYTIAQLRRIDEREVAPVLAGNLLSVAGTWAGFDTRELIADIEQRLADNGPLRRALDALVRPLRRSLTRDVWRRLTRAWEATRPTHPEA